MFTAVVRWWRSIIWPPFPRWRGWTWDGKE